MAGGVIGTCSGASSKCSVSKSTRARRGDGEVGEREGKVKAIGERKRKGESGGTAEVDTNEEPL